ncbi:biopolymer transport protein [Spiribacter salinus M19-40]|uniref:Biopolymer transport protein n=1 Tax=Spiribacter salinus M19-40 TaxID=1260251 RepID=R4V5P2_9GAMM|nr:biopolymer transporter ExbD [Spiribacter salinus]AGM41214.1 biopolymer transport protein [Spiribacter salinus M19-40]
MIRRGLLANLSATGRRTQGDPLLALINVVFLVLIFLMMSSALITPPPFALDPVRGEGESADFEEPARVAVSSAGSLAWGGKRLSENALIKRLEGEDAMGGVLITADGAVEANTVMGLVRRLEDAGLGPVHLHLPEREE